MVTAGTFRLPGPLAVADVQVDVMSGGRVELGLGTGWYDAEHTACGIGFPPLETRFEQLEEQLQLMCGPWASDGPYSFHGRHYDLVGNPALARPRRPADAAPAVLMLRRPC